MFRKSVLGLLLVTSSTFFLHAVSAASHHSKAPSTPFVREPLAKKIANTKQVAPLTSANGIARGGGPVTPKWALMTGLLLACNSGYMNGACLSGLLSFDKTKQAVAAVTGGYTTSAIGFASGNISVMKFQLGMILSYIAGSGIGGFLTPRNVVNYVVAPGASPALVIAGALVILAMQSVKAGNKQFMFLLALANGIQNSLTSSHSANTFRTSHYTGMSSDIGTFAGQYLAGNKANLWKLKIFVGLAVAFWGGGVLGYFSADKYGAMSLAASAAIYLGLAGLTLTK